MVVGIVANFPCKLFNYLVCSVIVTPPCLEMHRVILLSVFSKVKRDSGCAEPSVRQAVLYWRQGAKVIRIPIL